MTHTTIHTQGYFSWKGATIDNYRICDLRWQNFEVVDDAAASTASNPLALPAAEPDELGDRWTPEDNDRLSASLAGGLTASRLLDAARAQEAEAAAAANAAASTGGSNGKGRKPTKAAGPSLAQQMKDAFVARGVNDAAEKPQGLAAPLPPALGPLAQEFASVEELVDTVAAKAQGLPSPHLERKRREAAEAAAAEAAAQGKEGGAAGDAVEAEAGAGGKKPGQEAADVSTEDLRDAVAVATFQHAEAARVAERLRALALAQAAAAGAARQGGTAFVFRVLELAEERVETVLEALSFLDFGGAPVVIEYFVACSSAALLPKLGTKLNRRTPNPNLRTRRVLFNEAVRVELKDLVFHALVLDDWLHSGAAAWQQEEQEGDAAEQGSQQEQEEKEETRRPALLTASTAALQFLSRFLVPGAHVYVRGLTELPLWAALASQVSSTPLPLAPAGAEAAREEWEATLAAYDGGKPAEVIAANAVTPVLAGRFSRACWEGTAVEAGWVVAVAPSAEVRERRGEAGGKGFEMAGLDVLYCPQLILGELAD
jgi:hypothetical protein